MTIWRECPKCRKCIIISYHTFDGKCSLDDFKGEICECSSKDEDKKK